MPGLTAELHGEEETQATLKRAADFLRRREALDIAGEMVLDAAYGAFKTSRDPVTGLPWPSLMPSTIASRRGGGGGAKPLLDRGTLRASLQRGGPRSIWRYQGAEAVKVGTAHKTASWHNEGTGLFGPRRKAYTIEPKKGKMLKFIGAGGNTVFASFVTHTGVPPRRFLGVSNSMADEISMVMAKALDREMNHG